MTAASAAILWRIFLSPAPAAPARPILPIPTEPISIVGAPVDGSSNAPVAIIQYSEFLCPFCGTFARDTLPELRSKYIETGRALLAFIHLPLESLHPEARGAAVFAQCAQQRGDFWRVHDLLFATPKRSLSAPDLAVVDPKLGDTWRASCDLTAAGELVGRDIAASQKLKVMSTPTFFVGVRLPDGMIRVLNRLSGARPISAFDEVIAVVEKEIRSKR